MAAKSTECLEISFEEINFDSPVDEAIKIKDLAIEFFKKNPTGLVHFNFKGYSRLSEEFANKLFDDKLLIPYLGRIKTFGIHIFDQQRIVNAVEKADS